MLDLFTMGQSLFRELFTLNGNFVSNKFHDFGFKRLKPNASNNLTKTLRITSIISENWVRFCSGYCVVIHLSKIKNNNLAKRSKERNRSSS